MRRGPGVSKTTITRWWAGSTSAGGRSLHLVAGTARELFGRVRGAADDRTDVVERHGDEHVVQHERESLGGAEKCFLFRVTAGRGGSIWSVTCAPAGSSRRAARDRNMSSDTRAMTVVKFSMTPAMEIVIYPFREHRCREAVLRHPLRRGATPGRGVLRRPQRRRPGRRSLPQRPQQGMTGPASSTAVSIAQGGRRDVLRRVPPVRSRGGSLRPSPTPRPAFFERQPWHITRRAARDASPHERTGGNRDEKRHPDDVGVS